MKFLSWDGKVVKPGSYQPCNCCGLSLSKPTKNAPRSALKGLRVMEGVQLRDKDTPTFKIKGLATKAGPLTIVSKHYV